MFVMSCSVTGVMVWIAGVAAYAAATTTSATARTTAIVSRGACRSLLTALMCPLLGGVTCPLPCTRATVPRCPRTERSYLRDLEDALHPRRGVPGHGADVRVLLGLLEDDDELRRLLRLDQRRLLAVDLEVVRDRALVHDEEGHLPLRHDLLRELELELRRGDRDLRRGRRGRSGCAARRDDPRDERDRAHGDRKNQSDASHVKPPRCQQMEPGTGRPR